MWFVYPHTERDWCRPRNVTLLRLRERNRQHIGKQVLPHGTRPFFLEERKDVRSWTATSLCYLTGDLRVVGWLPEGTGRKSLTKARRFGEILFLDKKKHARGNFPSCHWLLLYEDETAGAGAAMLELWGDTGRNKANTLRMAEWKSLGSWRCRSVIEFINLQLSYSQLLLFISSYYWDDELSHCLDCFCLKEEVQELTSVKGIRIEIGWNKGREKVSITAQQ